MKNRKLLLIVSLVLALTMSLGGTLAYLQDSDADVNTMVLGNVQITQNEHQRVKNADGTYKTDTIDEQTSYVLEVYENDKPLLPTTELDANGQPYNYGAGNWDKTTVRMTQIGSYGGMQVFESENAADKFVTVTNTGKTDAYVRTFVAVEAGKTNGSLVGTSYHSTWTKNEIGLVEIEGNKYHVVEYVYAGAKNNDGSWLRHDNGVLPAGDTTYPNLSQVYLKAIANNNDMIDLDGNENGKLDILVLSQAIQANGFDNAKTALNAGFGAANETNVKAWFEGWDEDDIGTPGDKWPSNDVPVNYVEEIPEGATVIETAEDFMALSGKKVNGIYYLADNIDLQNAEFTSMYVYDSANGADVTFIGNGYKISNVTFVSEGENGMNNVGMFHVGSGSYGAKGNNLTIRNLTIENAVVTGTTSYCDAAVVISYLNGANTATLNNVDVVNANVTNTAGSAGLLIGYANSPIVLTDCNVSGTVVGERVDKTGGYVGTLNGAGITATVTNCTNGTTVVDFGRVVNGATVIE